MAESSWALSHGSTSSGLPNWYRYISGVRAAAKPTMSRQSRMPSTGGLVYSPPFHAGSSMMALRLASTMSTLHAGVRASGTSATRLSMNSG